MALTPQQQQALSDQKRKAGDAAQGKTDGANFQLGADASAAVAGAENSKAAGQTAISERKGDLFAAAKQVHDSQFTKANAIEGEQAKRGGVEVGQAVTQAGGISGVFGNKEVVNRYTAGKTEDPNQAANKARLDALAAEAQGRQAQTMQGAQIGSAAQIEQTQQAQIRGQQLAAIGQLQQQAAGNGPSAAQAQLKMGADRAMASNLAMAAAGGTAASARQAAFNNASAVQDMAGQSAALRAQEQQAAMGQLVGATQGARAQDIGLATDQAQLNQQTSLTQASLNQDTAKTNLLTGIDQQKQKDTMIAQYVAQGLTLDAAQRQAEIQQAQFNAELLARQAAADKGVAMQSSQAAGQTAGAIASAIGTTLAAASDKRAKKNIGDGDKSIERFLDSVAAKDWDYKDPAKHGEGRRTGIMAQDAEKNSDMVFTHKDGVKMLDLGKATSTSLAALANINKRLRQLEK